MARIVKKRSKKAGLAPGSLVHVGEKKVGEVRITKMEYDEHHFREEEVKRVEHCWPLKQAPTVTWINLDGIHQVEILEKLGHHFGLHPLILEDILNTDQRPKIDDLGEYLYIVLKMFFYNGKKMEIEAEQVSIILGANFVISFQEREGDVFNPIRERLREKKGRIQKMGADYLAYSLLDAVVDHYFVILEKLGEDIESLEEQLVANPSPQILQSINVLKREMIYLRRSVWPLREVIAHLERGESPLIQKDTGLYLRDVYDHTVQVIDAVETSRDILSGMLDIYLSSMSNRMNEVMKVLTIIATIFIPLTFIVGVYGMNFKYMPELEWPWGYPAVYGVMLAVVVLMLVYFKRRKWL